jgi:hypothetical protein
LPPNRITDLASGRQDGAATDARILGPDALVDLGGQIRKDGESVADAADASRDEGTDGGRDAGPEAGADGAGREAGGDQVGDGAGRAAKAVGCPGGCRRE